MDEWTLQAFSLEAAPPWGMGGEAPQEVELLEEPWESKAPGEVPIPEPIFFLDGKERVDGVVGKGERLGLLVTVAVGVARYQGGRLTLLEPTVRRYGLGVDEPLEAPGLRYEPRPLADPRRHVDAMHRLRVLLEQEAAKEVEGMGEGLLVQDGPIFWTPERGRVLGFVKTHWARYLPEPQEELLRALRPGERTPAFAIRREAGRFATWYLRLDPSPWALLRVETPPTPGFEERADLSGALFRFFASHPLRDRRAPQNLFPVGAIEGHLLRHMGSDVVVRRLLAERFGRRVWHAM